MLFVHPPPEMNDADAPCHAAFSNVRAAGRCRRAVPTARRTNAPTAHAHLLAGRSEDNGSAEAQRGRCPQARRRSGADEHGAALRAGEKRKEGDDVGMPVRRVRESCSPLFRSVRGALTRLLSPPSSFRRRDGIQRIPPFEARGPTPGRLRGQSCSWRSRQGLPHRGKVSGAQYPLCSVRSWRQARRLCMGTTCFLFDGRVSPDNPKPRYSDADHVSEPSGRPS